MAGTFCFDYGKYTSVVVTLMHVMLLLIEAAKQWPGNMNVPVTIDNLAE